MHGKKPDSAFNEQRVLLSQLVVGDPIEIIKKKVFQAKIIVPATDAFSSVLNSGFDDSKSKLRKRPD